MISRFNLNHVGLLAAVCISGATDLISLSDARADVTCVRATSKIVGGKVVTTLSRVNRVKCRSGEVKTLSGPVGPSGVDGQLRIYGDGSDGSRIISASETFDKPVAMYTDVVIKSGVTWSVPSGTVIRCSGTFINNGSIVVSKKAVGGAVRGLDSSSLMPVSRSPHPGISHQAATNGEAGSSSDSRSGGEGGGGLSPFEAASIRYPGLFGGGGAGAQLIGDGAKGGGSLVILAGGAIINNGSIIADGEDSLLGGGGGGGGVIVLASKGSISTGPGSSLLSRGGDGGRTSASTAAGGGGGGGIIHLMAPSISTSGATISVAAGDAGQLDTGVSINKDLRLGGGGGGASGGSGGKGASVFIDDSLFPAFDGQVGQVLTSVVDPTPLF